MNVKRKIDHRCVGLDFFILFFQNIKRFSRKKVNSIKTAVLLNRISILSILHFIKTQQF